MRIVLLLLLAFAAHAAPPAPALTGKRRAEIAQGKIVEKVERKKNGKKGSTNEWETARTFPLMFTPAKKGKKK